MTTARPDAAAPCAPIHIAPAPTSKPLAAAENGRHMNFTCATCSRRKVRCDKIGPKCATCRRARLECVWQEPAPKKRKRTAIQDVHERLEYYEALLRAHGVVPASNEQSTVATDRKLPCEDPKLSRNSPSSAAPLEAGKLVAGGGKSRYIDSHLWRNLGEDDLNPSSDEEDQDERNDHKSSAWPTLHSFTDPVSAGLLNLGSPAQSLLDLHPSYDTALQLWQRYVDNIDPIVKIVHVPSFQPILQRGAANPSSLPRSTEALMFSIYHFAVTSMTEEQCQTMFFRSQTELADRMHTAARQALVNAHFMRSTELMVLQAYLIFLLSVRLNYDSSTFWILTGIAVRMAERMGIHRDGEALGLDPFDVQMRRRFFWQLLPLDGMSGQICGTGLAMDAKGWDTKQPLNINDTDIWPGMKDPPMEREGATDMIFCLARSEVGRFHQETFAKLGSWSRLWNSADVEETERLLKLSEDKIELKYLRYCEFNNPVHGLTQAMARGSATAIRLRVRLARAREAHKVTDQDREEIWTLAKKIIDYVLAVSTSPIFAGFLWHMRSFFPWDGLVWMLNECLRDPSGPRNDEIWDKVEEVYHVYPEIIASRRALHMAIGRLTLRRWEAYVEAPSSSGRLRRPEPDFIPPLRAKFGKQKISTPNVETSDPSYNSFNPAQDEEDVWAYPMPPPKTPSTGNIAFNAVPDIDFSTTDLDWTYWDSLMNENGSILGPYDPAPQGPTSNWTA